MKTITQTTTVYDFDELSEDAKTIAIDNWYEDGHEYDLASRDFSDQAQELLELLGFTGIILSYSLSYCQGDGLSFLADTLSGARLIELLHRLKSGDIQEQGYVLLQELTKRMGNHFKDIDIVDSYIQDYDFSLSFHRSNFHYHHERSVTVDFDYSDSSTVTSEEITSDIADYLARLAYAFRSAYIDLCTKLAAVGYEEIYYRMTPEEFNDLCEANTYNFYVNGTMANL